MQERLCTNTLIPPKQIPDAHNANENNFDDWNMKQTFSMPLESSKNNDKNTAILQGRNRFKHAEIILNKHTQVQIESIENIAEDIAEDIEMHEGFMGFGFCGMGFFAAYFGFVIKLISNETKIWME